MRGASCLAPLTTAALLGACTFRPVAAEPLVWERLAPGLDRLTQPLAGKQRLVALRFDQGRYQLRLVAPPTGLKVPEDAPGDAIAIWNGGYFEHDLRPSGLVIDQGREVAAPSGGSGLALLGDRFSLLRFSAAQAANAHESALQLWPFLIEPGGADGIRRDDGKRARRSAIGLDDAGRGLLLAVIGEGISLYDLMALCRKLGAVVALNLDGGPSTGFAVFPPGAGAPRLAEPSETSVANALVLAPRPGTR